MSLKQRNELETVQAAFQETSTPFEVWGVCNCQMMDVQIFEHKGPVWHIRQCGKGVSITKTGRYDWNKEKKQFDTVKEEMHTHVETRKGLKSFKGWIDSLKPYPETGFFTSKLFNW